MQSKTTVQTKTWTRPQLVQLGTIADVAGGGQGTGEVNSGGQTKFLAAS